MKENKNKKRRARKYLPVILVVLMLVVALPVSVFADETACDDGHCWIPSGYVDEFVEEAQFYCDWCGKSGTYTVERPAVDTDCDCELYFSYVDVYYDGDDCIVGLVAYDCDCGSGYSAEWVFREKLAPAPTESKGIVSTIVSDVTTAVSTVLKGIGSTLVNFFDTAVVKDGKLTTYAAWTLTFVGIGFGAGFLRKLLKKAG